MQRNRKFSWLALSQWHLLPIIRSRNESTSAHRKIKPWMEQCFTYKEKRHSKIRLNSGHWSPTASGSFLAANTGQLALLWCDPIRFLQRTEVALGLSRCHLIHMAQQYKVLLESETEKVIPTQHDKSSTGCWDSLSQGKKVFQRLRWWSSN